MHRVLEVLGHMVKIIKVHCILFGYNSIEHEMNEKQ